MTTRKITLWEVQQKADERNFDYYEKLSIEEKKQVALYPLMRGFSIVDASPEIQEYYLIMTNNIANKGFWNLSKYPELQWKLISSCGIGFKQKHKWISAGKRASKTPNIDELLFKVNPKMNNEELEIVKSKLTKEYLIELTRNYGISDKDGKVYIEEFKKI